MEEAILYPLPPPSDAVPRRLTESEAARVDLLCRLLFFLATAPTKWSILPQNHLPDLSKFRLPNGEDVACILWNGLYHITGTDIGKLKFEAFGRPIKHTKKWEEGVFSDLRNLKPGVDACLEEPKSAFLDFLFRNGCIRTQKKQKVFYWFSVPHDRLFLDALERDLKREKAGQEPTSIVVGEPARSFRYDPRRGLYEQFMGSNRGMEAAILDQVYPLQARLHPSPIIAPPSALNEDSRQSSIDPTLRDYSRVVDSSSDPGFWSSAIGSVDERAASLGFVQDVTESSIVHPPTIPEFTVTMFKGSPAYKRKRVRSKRESTSNDHTETDGDGEANDVILGSSALQGFDSNNMAPSQARRKVMRSLSASSPSHITDSIVGTNSVPTQTVPIAVTDDKAFVCVFDFCRRPFKRLEHLKRHIRTHTQERPFACKLCSRAFSRQDNLLQHLRLHRKDDPPRANDVAEDRLSAPPYLGRRWPVQSPAPVDDGFSQLSIAHNAPYPPQTFANMNQRSTTVPPNWLSLAPPSAPWSTVNAPSLAIGAPSQYSLNQGPLRFRSSTPQLMSGAYTYGVMAPPPAPPTLGDMNGLPPGNVSAFYPAYTNSRLQEYPLVPNWNMEAEPASLPLTIPNEITPIVPGDSEAEDFDGINRAESGKW